MADTNWTQAQKDAINIRNSNVLVSAAAGSGKTAVLIERVLRLLSDPADPADLDEMVIMTFTEAAAKGMVEKLYKKLRKAVKEQPSNDHLKRQLLKVHTARICTIDALCGRIVRENFQSLDIDPMYRIMDEAEKTLLEQEVLGEVLEEAYADNSPAFILLVESYMN
ncbi:MAG: UvrD-helicase domain-containing protein, partial [Parasporobacterium sp.]|nr:UvrD-helicase domain-containing protein [Parasporobacterium sp.]